ncbi:methyltransferase [Arthrobacter phage Orcanus]|nr:methyltransferase [Arthrobacter phage Orcanus]
MRLSDQVREEAGRGKFMPTPRASDGDKGGPNQRGSKGDLTMPSLAPRLLPTPEAKLSDAGPDFARAGRAGSGGDDLTTTVARLFPTPTTQDGSNNGGPSQFLRNTPPLNTAVLMLPTPRTTDSKTYGASATARSRVESGIANLGETVAVKVADVEWGEYEPAVRRWEQVMGPAPSPTEPTAKGTLRLSARFTEWMMGQPEGWITSPEIGLSRNEQLKACGNGVVTQQASAALADMLATNN